MQNEHTCLEHCQGLFYSSMTILEQGVHITLPEQMFNLV